ncbi:MAG: polysaccharide deacetylase family protein [Smithella sp.]|nr:polysaccharide deacetylase family protein [Smithella sp.]MDD5527622.1 polysaccharide deacetylase family protein [Patescibacteria group bacterium]
MKQQIKYIKNYSRKDNKIVFSFDDGPNSYYTLKIVDILNKYGVKGIFFLIGKRCEEYPLLVKKILQNGHLIGNHTYSHDRTGDFAKCGAAIKKICGFEPLFVRPPFYDLSICKKESDYLKNKIIITGDVDSKDYLDISSSDVVSNVLRSISNGSIVDFHDGSESNKDLKKRAKKTLAALPFLIKSIKNKYVVSLPNKLKSRPHFYC